MVDGGVVDVIRDEVAKLSVGGGTGVIGLKPETGFRL